MSEVNNDTIVAQSTPPGRGGVGIIRLSGPQATTIAEKMIKSLPQPRQAQFREFHDNDNAIIDMGLVLYFPAPYSFTGEDVVELQGHGGPVVIDALLTQLVNLGARIAKPGEFSERAFLNGKMDLNQAEAIADLIDSASQKAARCAIRSLQGVFSEQVNAIVESITKLRMYVESSIDFTDEDIDFLGDGKISSDLTLIIEQLDDLRDVTKQGTLLREGMNVVIAGKPNAGKSRLLNSLSGRESAIVTDIPGTTRDLLREYILIDGIPLHIIDTAGLRETPDVIEQEGVRRAWDEISKADRVLLMVDGTTTQETDPNKLWPPFAEAEIPDKAITIIRNKCDLTDEPVGISYEKELTIITLSAKHGQGVDLLREHLKDCVGADIDEGSFIARRRHLDALKRARKYLAHGQDQFSESQAGELLAEDLRQAQNALGEITGQFTTDDLLGRIFSEFCIGK